MSSSTLFKKVDSSDYIAFKKRVAIAEEYRNSKQNPVKMNGKQYNNNFIFVPKLTTPITDISNCLIQAKSYELKGDYTNGETYIDKICANTK